MAGENCTVLRLRLMHKLAMSHNSIYTGATDWRSEQLLSTERSHDLIEAFPYSEKFDNIGNDTDTRETDWSGHYLV